jgi:NADPH:quinone reductase-like Zn-dependent oxidoreductase
MAIVSSPPATMKAAALSRFGGPSVLSRRELPVPEPGPGEVLIAMHTAGVGVWDAEIRKGNWRPPGRSRFPLVPGVDGSGTVVRVGARVNRLRRGDRVYAYEFGNRKGGFYAEYTVVHARYAARVPKPLTLEQAGAAAVTALTALQGVDQALRLRRGDVLLVFGASGAVGTLALQLAKRRGARVLATASGRAAQALVRRLGADVVVDARASDATDRLRALAPDGLDAVLAFAGGDALERCLDLLKKGGRLAYPNGVEPVPRARKGLRRAAYDAEASPQQLARVARAVSESRLRVPIAARYALGSAAQAHRRLERGRVVGRIVLRIRAPGSGR